MSNKNEVIMKRLMILFMFCGMLITAMADWTYGTATFKGNQPSSSMTHGSIRIWYNGSLTQKGTEEGVEIWEGTGDICVVFPKYYNGPKMNFTTTGGSVQIQTLQ
jgi:hypothetical protein